MRRSPAVVLAVALAGCGAGRSERVHVTMRATPEGALVSRPVSVDIAGLPAGGTATLRATWRSVDGILWASRQVVRADSQGRVALRGVDGMRFLWAMRPLRGEPPFFDAPTGISTIRLELMRGDTVLARSSLYRRGQARGVTARTLSLRRDRLVGAFYAPAPGRARGPAVLTLGGAEGAAPTYVAAPLASVGYPALALSYFDAPGLPRELDRVPLEYFARALRWLARRRGVDPRRVVVEGGSRGGEAALLVASTFPRLVHGAVAVTPSYQVVGACCGPAVAGDEAWTLHGRALTATQIIPVERISGPVLTVSGGRDEESDTSFSTQQIERRLIEHHFRYRHQRLNFPEASHEIAPPETPGVTRANAVAGEAVQRAVIRYLRALG